MYGRLKVLAGLLVVLAGCDTPTDVRVQDTPFYYHQDTPIYLDIDDDELTIATEASDVAIIEGILEGVGIQIASIEGLRSIRGMPHWLVRLSGPSNMAGLAQMLWRRTDVMFASPVMYAQEGGGRIELVNDLRVHVHEGTVEAEVREVQRGFELVHVSGPSGSFDRDYDYRYPASSSRTALEIAAAVHRHPTVEWTSPNFISDISR